jgi:hypothetical protein
MGMIRQAYIEAPISMAILGLSLAIGIGFLLWARKELEGSAEQTATRLINGVMLAGAIALFTAYNVFSALAAKI